MEEFTRRDLFGIMSGRDLLIIFHLFGLALGAGAAFFSDFLFSHIMKDRKVSNTEFKLLKLASRVVWLGLALLVVSGALIFMGDSQRLSESDKFLAKMTIIAVLIVNGMVFHILQIPALKKFLGKDLAKSPQFMKKYATPFFIGGAVSGASWAAALVLGSLGSLDMTYQTIMIIYVSVLLLCVPVALSLKKKFLS